ncbi:MAG: EamA family transporter [Victivallaceae bacterium]
MKKIIRTLLYILLQGTVDMAAMSCLVFWGQETTSAVNSSTIMASIPVMVMLAGLSSAEKIRPIQYFGIALATAGCLVVIRIIDPAASVSMRQTAATC